MLTNSGKKAGSLLDLYKEKMKKGSPVVNPYNQQRFNEIKPPQSQPMITSTIRDIQQNQQPVQKPIQQPRFEQPQEPAQQPNNFNLKPFDSSTNARISASTKPIAGYLLSNSTQEDRDTTGASAVFSTTYIPLTALHAFVGTDNLKTMQDEAKQWKKERPIASTVVEGVGQLLNYLTAAKLLSPAISPVANKISNVGGIRSLAPTVSRIAGRVVSFGSIGAIVGGLREALKQTTNEKYDIGAVAKESAIEGAYMGTTFGASGALTTTVQRLAATGGTTATWTLIEEFIKDKSISAEDLVNVGINSVINMIFELSSGAGSKTKKFELKKIENLLQDKLIARIMGNNKGMTRAEAQGRATVLEALPKTINDYIQTKTVLQQLIKDTNVPASFNKLTLKKQFEYIWKLKENITRGEELPVAILNTNKFFNLQEDNQQLLIEARQQQILQQLQQFPQLPVGTSNVPNITPVNTEQAAFQILNPKAVTHLKSLNTRLQTNLKKKEELIKTGRADRETLNSVKSLKQAIVTLEEKIKTAQTNQIQTTGPLLKSKQNSITLQDKFIDRTKLSKNAVTFIDNWHKETKKTDIPKELEKEFEQYKPTKPVTLYRGLLIDKNKPVNYTKNPTSWSKERMIAEDYLTEADVHLGKKNLTPILLKATFEPKDVFVDLEKILKPIRFANTEEMIIKPGKYKIEIINKPTEAPTTKIITQIEQKGKQSTKIETPEKLYVPLDKNNKISLDRRGTLNLGTNESQMKRFGSTVELDTKDFKVKTFETKAQLFSAGANKAYWANKGYDILVAENQAIATNSSNISKLIDVPVSKPFSQKVSALMQKYKSKITPKPLKVKEKTDTELQKEAYAKAKEIRQKVKQGKSYQDYVDEANKKAKKPTETQDQIRTRLAVEKAEVAKRRERGEYTQYEISKGIKREDLKKQSDVYKDLQKYKDAGKDEMFFHDLVNKYYLDYLDGITKTDRSEIVTKFIEDQFIEDIGLPGFSASKGEFITDNNLKLIEAPKLRHLEAKDYSSPDSISPEVKKYVDMFKREFSYYNDAPVKYIKIGNGPAFMDSSKAIVINSKNLQNDFNKIERYRKIELPRGGVLEVPKNANVDEYKLRYLKMVLDHEMLHLQFNTIPQWERLNKAIEENNHTEFTKISDEMEDTVYEKLQKKEGMYPVTYSFLKESRGFENVPKKEIVKLRNDAQKQGISKYTLNTINDTLGEFGENINVVKFLKALHEKNSYLQLAVSDKRHYVGTQQTSSANKYIEKNKEKYFEQVFKLPFTYEGNYEANPHYPELNDYFAQVRGFIKDDTLFIDEIQSDLMQNDEWKRVEWDKINPETAKDIMKYNTKHWDTRLVEELITRNNGKFNKLAIKTENPKHGYSIIDINARNKFVDKRNHYLTENPNFVDATITIYSSNNNFLPIMSDAMGEAVEKIYSFTPLEEINTIPHIKNFSEKPKLEKVNALIHMLHSDKKMKTVYPFEKVFDFVYLKLLDLYNGDMVAEDIYSSLPNVIEDLINEYPDIHEFSEMDYSLDEISDDIGRVITRINEEGMDVDGHLQSDYIKIKEISGVLHFVSKSNKKEDIILKKEEKLTRVKEAYDKYKESFEKFNDILNNNFDKNIEIFKNEYNIIYKNVEYSYLKIYVNKKLNSSYEKKVFDIKREIRNKEFVKRYNEKIPQYLKDSNYSISEKEQFEQKYSIIDLPNKPLDEVALPGFSNEIRAVANETFELIKSGASEEKLLDKYKEELEKRPETSGAVLDIINNQHGFIPVNKLIDWITLKPLEQIANKGAEVMWKYMYKKVAGPQLVASIKKVTSKSKLIDALGTRAIYEYRQPQWYKDLTAAAERDLIKSSNIAREMMTYLDQGLTRDEKMQLQMAIINDGYHPDPKIGDRARVARDILDDYGEQFYKVGAISQETFEANKGEYLMTAYYSKELQKSFLDFLSSTSQKAKLKRTMKKGLEKIVEEAKAQKLIAQGWEDRGALKSKKGYRRVWRDWTTEEKTKWGQILDNPAYLVSKGIMQVGYDVAVLRKFQEIAKHTDYVKDEAFKDYIKMPDEKGYGALRGKYVEPIIAQDIKGRLELRDQATKLASQLVSQWKMFKVIDNPATHMRNMYFNFLLSDIAGLSPVRQDIYIQALIEVFKKTGDYVEARNLGTFGDTFIGQELGGLLDGTTKKDLSRILDAYKDENGVYKIDMKQAPQSVLQLLAKLKKTYDAAQSRLGKIYQGEEEWNKLALYKYAKYDLNLSPVEASKFAKKWGLNYSRVTPFLAKFSQKWYGMPFIRFQAVLLPVAAEAMVTRSFSILKIILALYLMEESSRKALGYTRKQLQILKQKVMPDWMQGGLYILSPTLNEDGNPEFFDMSYIIPYVQDIKAFDPTNYVYQNPLFNFGGAMIYNKDPFTGKEIYTQLGLEKDWSEYSKDTANYLIKQIVPPLMPKGYSYDKIKKEIMTSSDTERTKQERLRSFLTVMADAMLGLKFREIDIESEIGYRVKDFIDSKSRYDTRLDEILNKKGEYARMTDEQRANEYVKTELQYEDMLKEAAKEVDDKQMLDFFFPEE